MNGWGFTFVFSAYTFSNPFFLGLKNRRLMTGFFLIKKVTGLRDGTRLIWVGKRLVEVLDGLELREIIQRPLS